MKTPILIVDDHASIRELLEDVLEQAGFEVTAASNGQTALELMQKFRFGLVLLDVNMPHMSGLDVLKAMADVPFAPPALMITANGDSATVREAVALGCAGYLTKPFAPAALVQRVKRALVPPPLSLSI